MSLAVSCALEGAAPLTDLRTILPPAAIVTQCLLERLEALRQVQREIERVRQELVLLRLALQVAGEHPFPENTP